MRGASEAVNGMFGRRMANPYGRPSASAGPASALAEIGALFRDLRRALRISLPALASRLGTRIEVISALEAGNVARLPSWPETVRVVTAFTGLAGIDPRPVLHALNEARNAAAPVPAGSRAGEAMARLRSMGRRAASAAGTALEVARRGGEADAPSSARASLGRYAAALRKTSLAASAALALSLGTYYVNSGRLAASIAALPPPLTDALRGVQDFVLSQTAPTRDGMRWIDVDDPRTRRGDRLDIGGR